MYPSFNDSSRALVVINSLILALVSTQLSVAISRSAAWKLGHYHPMMTSAAATALSPL
jgi:ABC-type spermidine/putrescine transport system permease subunit II